MDSSDIRGRTYAVSDTISPRTPVKPNAPAATAAAAMVFTLFGARGHSSATDPLNKTRRPSPSFQSERASPVSRKQDGCLDILTKTPWKHRSVLSQVNPDNRNELLSIVGDYISTLSPLIFHYHSFSVCLGLPIMHRWVHKVSCCTCEPPDGAPGLNHHQRGQRESPPLRRKTYNTGCYGCQNYFSPSRHIWDFKFVSHHKMSMGQEERPKFFNYLWMAYLYNQVTPPAKPRDTHACS